MNMLPHLSLALPHAGLFAANGDRLAGLIDALHQPHVADDGHVAQEPHVRAAHRRVVRAGDSAQSKIEMMELHSLDQLPAGLRLERRERRVAQFGVGLPIAVGDARQEPLVQIENVLDRCVFVVGREGS